MSTQTPNIGLTKMVSSETIGAWSDANNGSGGNLDIIDTKMGAVGNTSLQAQINTLNSNLGGTKIFAISKTITVPAGNSTTPGQLQIDFSSDIGSSSIWFAFASIGPSALPYSNNAGAVKTWIRTIDGSPAQAVTIYNTDTEWTNKTAYFVLICK